MTRLARTEHVVVIRLRGLALFVGGQRVDHIIEIRLVALEPLQRQIENVLHLCLSEERRRRELIVLRVDAAHGQADELLDLGLR